MKKCLSVFLVTVIIVTGVYVNPVITQSASWQDVYQESYGIQLGEEAESLSRYIYNQMVHAYIYQKGDFGNTGGKYTGMAKPPADNGKVTLKADLIANKTFKDVNEFQSYNWMESDEYKTIDNAVRDAFDAFLKDYPQVYWIKNMEWSTKIEIRNFKKGNNGLQVEVVFRTTLKPSEYEDGISGYIRSFNDAVCEATENIVKQNRITVNTKKEDIVKYVHDYVASKTDYNFEVAINSQHKDYNYAHTPLPVFVSSSKWGNKIVCEGYAKAFKILCDRLDIESSILVGQSINLQGQYEAHMWNAVLIMNQWYAVDVAWDDQGDRVYDIYILAGRSSKGFYNIYEIDHLVENQFSAYKDSKEFVLPQIAEKGFFQREESTSKIEESSTTENNTESGEESSTTENNTESGEESSTTEKVTESGEKSSTTEKVTEPDKETSTVGDIDEKETTTAKQVEAPTTNVVIKKVSYHWVVSGLVTSKTFTGKQVKQKIKITCGGKILKENTDYKISYKNNIKVGTAKILIIPTGKYKNVNELKFTYNYKIAKASITKTSINKIKAQKYKKGKAVKPSVRLKFNGRKLKKGKDYTISYKNNKKKGTAKIIIKGKGNFKGTKTVKFKIK